MSSVSWVDLMELANALAKRWQERFEPDMVADICSELFGLFGARELADRYRREAARRFGEDVYMFWPGVLIATARTPAYKAEGVANFDELFEPYLDRLPRQDWPRFLLRFDFAKAPGHLWVTDRIVGSSIGFACTDLAYFIQEFGFIAGAHRPVFCDDGGGAASAEAAQAIVRVRQALADQHPGTDLRPFLVRLAFLLLADDHGVLAPRDRLRRALENHPRDMAGQIRSIAAEMRPVETILAIPVIPIPEFGAAAQTALLDAVRLNWAEVSPVSFGPLLREAVEGRPVEAAGVVSEAEMMSEPGLLFLKDMKSEFKKVRSQELSSLQDFHERLATLKIIDPSCDTGSYLVLIYREMKRLELEVLGVMRVVAALRGGRARATATRVLVNAGQMHGGEGDEHSVHIARAMIRITDHIMNNRLARKRLRAGAVFEALREPHFAAKVSGDGDGLVVSRGPVRLAA